MAYVLNDLVKIYTDIKRLPLVAVFFVLKFDELNNYL